MQDIGQANYRNYGTLPVEIVFLVFLDQDHQADYNEKKPKKLAKAYAV